MVSVTVPASPLSGDTWTQSPTDFESDNSIRHGAVVVKLAVVSCSPPPVFSGNTISCVSSVTSVNTSSIDF